MPQLSRTLKQNENRQQQKRNLRFRFCFVPSHHFMQMGFGRAGEGGRVPQPAPGNIAEPDGVLRASTGEEARKEGGRVLQPGHRWFCQTRWRIACFKGQGSREGGRVLQPDHRWFCRTRWRIACFKGRTKEGNKANNHGVSQSDGKKLCGGGNHAPATCHTKHPTCCAEYSAILGINHRWIDSPR